MFGDLSALAWLCPGVNTLAGPFSYCKCDNLHVFICSNYIYIYIHICLVFMKINGKEHSL